MCDVFQLLKYFDNFYNFTSPYQKFSRKHQFCQHYIQLLDARRVHFVPNKQIGKLDSHQSTMGSMMEIFLRLVNYFVTFADPEMAYMCLDDNNLAMEDEAEVDGAQIQELGSEEEGEHFVYPAETKKRGVAE